MAKWYLCTLKPLEDYFFGGERVFDINPHDRKEKTERIDYLIRSERLPSQATLLGMLRFLVLLNKKELNENNRRADRDKQDRQNALIGARSFSMEGEEKQDYGQILELSPLFLLENRKKAGQSPELHHWIRTPANHKNGKSNYEPLKMTGPFFTERGEETLLPEGYDAKEGVADGYLDIDSDDLEIKDSYEIFSERIQTHIRKGAEQDGLFKKVSQSLDPRFRFAFFCCVKEEDTLPERETVFLGQGKSAFLFAREDVGSYGPEQIEDRIGRLPGQEGLQICYALSGLYLSDDTAQKGLRFSYILKKNLRTLETKWGDNFLESRRKSERYQMVEAGSMFYYPEGLNSLQEALKNDRLQQIGWNKIVVLGGKKNG